MKIVVAGGSGFLGRRLVGACRGDGHDVTVLTRRAPGADDVLWTPGAGVASWAGVLEHADAVVNLAGEGIADKRWTAARKREILDSRVLATRTLSDGIRGCAHPPRLFLSASAVGFYGTRGDEELTERSTGGSDFLATVCRAWEKEAREAAGVTRVVLLRTGVVLAGDGGALPRMALPFRFYVGGRLGSGRQYISWIHVDDWVGMVRWVLSNAPSSGPVNLTAPSPVTNEQFTRELAAAMHRPARFPVPAFALRAMLGRELADALLLGGQRVLPATAQQLGFQFRFATVEAALRDIFQPRRT
jgi:uncharacterized protein (TIGR01777 family)